ncbi:MAG: phosphoribosylanthranilate isomerase [Candidatus Marinimicrobia bacterium]|nr:phosphoribosylanthranilate isomerase [Candidatus Neomarinimicrobiota bacterium]MBT3680985.1 phosphoribosylanthranilate isomerase [Candidatus Neomarinimicrobiota bacterium]MBT3952118.1 phosphoribosylanthranilate isomerase [Candidatus Neomarinimicrobiota bacterium]MBT4254316.1 phosphoribosylanthranilate isomerase [Candidatus Neomarinimicrobiota bacterium]MBT4479497.1 phosphoribosylanthranilate isomerase [Candidatus Neomarinimicrobiota bacterium]
MNYLIKVCCISSLTEAKMALSAGADLLGLVSEMPSGPGVIPLDQIEEIVVGLPADTKTVLLTSKHRHDDILKQHNQVKTWGVQLVDKVADSVLKELRKSLPSTRFIQVIHVKDEASISQALHYDNLVDMILLDSGNPKAKIKTLGGTGKPHDWKISREICARGSLPVLLAGGLSPENILTARTVVQPSGFDICSGVRSDGKLNQNKLESFMKRVRSKEGKLT